MTIDNRTQLQAFIERIERLEDEKKAIASDITDIYKEIKNTGYDTKAIKTIIKKRKLTKQALQEEQAILDLYMLELGMITQ